MAFWTDQTLEPKRKYRFLVRFPGFDGGQGLTFVAKKATKPKITITETPHKYIDHTFYYPGNVEWDPVTVTIVDPVDPDAAKGFSSVLEASGYIIPSNANQVTTISKASAVGTLGGVTIEQFGSGLLNPGGDIPKEALERWTLRNVWIKSINFSDLDYESDDLSEIEIELRYDWAELESFGQPSGHTIADNIRGSQGLEGDVFWKKPPSDI